MLCTNSRCPASPQYCQYVSPDSCTSVALPVQDQEERRATHWVVGELPLAAGLKQGKAAVLYTSWLEACLAEGKRVSETRHAVPAECLVGQAPGANPLPSISTLYDCKYVSCPGQVEVQAAALPRCQQCVHAEEELGLQLQNQKLQTAAVPRMGGCRITVAGWDIGSQNMTASAMCCSWSYR